MEGWVCCPSYGIQLKRMRVIDRVGFDFLMTELRVGMTLARGVSLKRHPDGRQRTIGAARHAYDTCARLAARLELTDGQQRKLHRGMVKLKATLEQLGETF